MFPDVDPLYVKNLLLRYIGPEALNNVCNLLLENANYPRVQRGTTSTVSSEPPPKKVWCFTCKYICMKQLSSQYTLSSEPLPHKKNWLQGCKTYTSSFFLNSIPLFGYIFKSGTGQNWACVCLIILFV